MKVKEQKYPELKPFAFTKTALLEAGERAKALGLKQVEFSCKVHRGLRAVIYGSTGRIVLYSRYSCRNRPQRIKLGELGLITLDQARAAHQANRLKASQGVDPRTPTLSDMTYRQLHEEHYVVQRRARQKKTLHTDLSRHANWLGPEFDAERIVDITKTDVSRFVLRMQEAGLAPATIRTTVGQLKATLDIAVELEIVSRNVAKGVGLPRVNNRRTEFITVPQMQAFMAAARASDQLVGSRLLMLLALTGARLGEGLAAKWADVDLDAGLWRLAYRAGLSIADHARPHAGGRYLLKLDFKDFFPSIKWSALAYRLERDTEYSAIELWILSNLLCRKVDPSGLLELSIGAPSSPHVSNYFLHEFDARLTAFCSSHATRYTRYADDLAFSTSTPGALDVIEREVRRLLGELDYMGLRLNEEKTVNVSTKTRRRLVGLILSNDGRASIGRDAKRELRLAMHHAAQGTLEPSKIAHLRGRLAFTYGVDPAFVDCLLARYGFASIAEIGNVDPPD